MWCDRRRRATMILSSNNRSSLILMLNRPFSHNNVFSDALLGVYFFFNFFKSSLSHFFLALQVHFSSACFTPTLLRKVVASTSMHFFFQSLVLFRRPPWHLFSFLSWRLLISLIGSSLDSSISSSVISMLVLSCMWVKIKVISVRIRRAIVQCRWNTFFSSLCRLCLSGFLELFETRINCISCDPWLRYDGVLNDVAWLVLLFGLRNGPRSVSFTRILVLVGVRNVVSVCRIWPDPNTVWAPKLEFPTIVRGS